MWQRLKYLSLRSGVSFFLGTLNLVPGCRPAQIPPSSAASDPLGSRAPGKGTGLEPTALPQETPGEGGTNSSQPNLAQAVGAKEGFPFQWEGATVSLSKADLDSIGQQIFQNEAGGDPEKLVYWNPAEAFPSLGIGHFIWFAKDCGACRDFGGGTGSFYGLAHYLKGKGVAIPDYVFAHGGYCPWTSRSLFLRAGMQTQELRKVLQETKALQAQYIVETNLGKLPQLGQNAELKARITEVLHSKGSVFLLIDYINFKGDGNGSGARGWGLKQVLESMKSNTGDASAAFTDAADLVLTRRTQDRPADRQFLAGWRNRINRYRTFVLPSKSGQ